MLTCAFKAQDKEPNIITFVEMCAFNLLFEFIIIRMHKI